MKIWKDVISNKNFLYIDSLTNALINKTHKLIIVHP